MAGPVSLARYKDFSKGHWGAAGARNGEKGSWGGRNVILTRDGGIAPVSASRAIRLSNLKVGRIAGHHWAWGVDGRIYFLQQIVGTSEGLTLTGASGSYASAPDAAAWNVSGVMRIVARITAIDYSAAAAQIILAHWVDAANQRSWAFALNTSGDLVFQLSSDGSATTVNQASSALAAVNNETMWVAVEYNTGTGALTFYKAGDQDTLPPVWAGWTQVSTHTVTAAVPFNSTATVELGARQIGTAERFSGTVYRASVYDDGVAIANADFSNTGVPRAVAGAATYTDSAAVVWTIHPPATIAGDGPDGQYQLRRFALDLDAPVTIEDIGDPIATMTRKPDWADVGGDLLFTVYSEGTYRIAPAGPTLTKLTAAPGDAPGGRSLSVYGERLMVAGIDDARLGTVGTRVCYSEAADIANFPDDNFFDAGVDTSEIGSLNVLADQLVIIFADQQIWVFRGTPGTTASSLRRAYGFHQGTGGTESFGPGDSAVDPSQNRVWIYDHPSRGLARFSGTQFTRVPGFGVVSGERDVVADASGGVFAMGGPDDVFVDLVPMPRTDGDSAAGDNLELIRVNGVFSLVDRIVVAGS